MSTEYPSTTGPASTPRSSTRPGATTIVPMIETQPGRFTANTTAPVDGIYPIRVTAVGVTFNGTLFTREQTLTGAVFHGGPLCQACLRHHPVYRVCE